MTALAVLAIAAAAVAARAAGATSTTASPTATPWPTPALPLALTTADFLHAVAGRIQNAPPDPHAGGGYTYHHLRRWTLDTTDPRQPRPGMRTPVGRSASRAALEVAHYRRTPT